MSQPTDKGSAPDTLKQTKKPPIPERKFNINPVELGIFLVVLLIFSNSAYRLLYDWNGLSSEVVVGTKPVDSSFERAPASRVNPFLDIECDKFSEEVPTPLSKIRLRGTYCRDRAETRNQRLRLIKTEIMNDANNTKATVFTDATSETYQTDFIPLNTGKNSISLKFFYDGGKVFTNEVTVNRDTDHVTEHGKLSE